ncbi:hypothetical protein MIND_01028400 [Mycena indigotica]|uniref:Apoptogenic protein 1 n=1 Tax=Mycena indigotica TaxID=2126181 RepID=A0A8H6S8Q9_9AGAR|nr:uncharacterized protein MIND_01028400 [Mycena indigotica]KAF7294904.1 hypothetical protein MIND_01028400 [Mycena indigotica]
MLHFRPPSRCLHRSCRVLADRVGPPHPISNMRPVVYDDDEPTSAPRAYHPYSLHEFDPTPNTSPHKLHWKLLRQQNDQFHHEFWIESNTRFERGKIAALAALPSTATALDKERALSAFYKQWVTQEEPRITRYTEEWRQRNSAALSVAFRAEYQKLTSRVLKLFNNF